MREGQTSRLGISYVASLRAADLVVRWCHATGSGLLQSHHGNLQHAEVVAEPFGRCFAREALQKGVDTPSLTRDERNDAVAARLEDNLVSFATALPASPHEEPEADDCLRPPVFHSLLP